MSDYDNCVKCHKSIKKPRYYVVCDSVGPKCHGDGCECLLPVGPECRKKFPEWAQWVIEDGDSYPLYSTDGVPKGSREKLRNFKKGVSE